MPSACQHQPPCLRIYQQPQGTRGVRQSNKPRGHEEAPVLPRDLRQGPSAAAALLQQADARQVHLPGHDALQGEEHPFRFHALRRIHLRERGQFLRSVHGRRDLSVLSVLAAENDSRNLVGGSAGYAAHHEVRPCHPHGWHRQEAAYRTEQKDTPPLQEPAYLPAHKPEGRHKALRGPRACHQQHRQDVRVERRVADSLLHSQEHRGPRECGERHGGRTCACHPAHRG